MDKRQLEVNEVCELIREKIATSRALRRPVLVALRGFAARFCEQYLRERLNARQSGPQWRGNDWSVTLLDA